MRKNPSRDKWIIKYKSTHIDLIYNIIKYLLPTPFHMILYVFYCYYFAQMMTGFSNYTLNEST